MCVYACPPLELMKSHPEQAVEALIIHNNLITKAKWDCFGSTVEQEGGERACCRYAFKQICLVWDRKL